jgi:predicted transcriptional regulator
MKAVARGERRAPRDAARPSFNSVAALVRLLTPENRALLATLRDRSQPGAPSGSGRFRMASTG